MDSFGRLSGRPGWRLGSRPGPGRAAGRALFLVLVAGALSQCSSASVGNAFVDPGTFQYYDCPGLKNLTTAKRARLKVLNGLTQEAEREPAGVIVAATAYRSEQATLHADLRNISRIEAEKKCDAAPPPS